MTCFSLLLCPFSNSGKKATGYETAGLVKGPAARQVFFNPKPTSGADGLEKSCNLRCLQDSRKAVGIRGRATRYGVFQPRECRRPGDRSAAWLFAFAGMR
jgi:hypothetical protein